MPEKITDSTRLLCLTKDLLFKQVNKEIYRNSNYQSRFSNQFIVSKLQIQFALQIRKIVGLSVLASIGLIASSIGSAWANS
jgi:hypothetical protein